MKHVMIDLETLGLDPYSAIISLGAVYFDLSEPEIIQSTFEVHIELASAVGAGLRMDPATVEWWLSSERDDARKYWLSSDRVELQAALHGFTQWLSYFSEKDERAIWGNGSDFDNALLGQAYKVSNIEQPWSYKGNRCFRTLKALAASNVLKPPDDSLPGLKHTALGDAIYQTRWLHNIVASLDNIAL